MKHIKCPCCSEKIDLKKEVVKARFLKKIKKDKASGCWFWKASKLPSGYGTFSYNGRCSYAHRVSYELFVGPIPMDESLSVMHSCHFRNCVNPDHLSLGSHKENMAQISSNPNFDVKTGKFKIVG
jgi:hypothetical protein